METLKTNIDTQKKISIITDEVCKLEMVLEKKINNNKNKVKHLEQLHKNTMEYYDVIFKNLQ